jgi:serine/threonine protein kinase
MSDLRERLQSGMNDRYRLERELGRGGMATVFLATDLKHKLRGDEATPNDHQRHVLLGLALAFLGRKAEAIAEGKRGVALKTIADDAYNGPYHQHQLARIYMLVGEPEQALDQLEPLLKIPSFLSPGWLKVDPNFAPLRQNPRFQRLVAGKE